MNNEQMTTQQEQPDVSAKTFSQEDVNRIVQERLSKERSKADGAIAQREQELVKREFRLYAKEELDKAGLPAKFIDALDTSSKEAFDAALTLIAGEMGKKVADDRGGFQVGTLQGHGMSASVRAAMGLNKKE